MRICRPVIVLSSLVALPAALAAVVLAGQTGTAQASAPSLPAAAATVSARIAHAPQAITLASKPTVRVAAVRPVARKATTPVAAPKAAAVRATAPRPVAPAAAPKPAVKPAAQPAPTATQPTAAPAPASTANDYPWRSATTTDADTWGFTKRQCVSFAAFRLSQRGKAIDNVSQHWGSALNWDETARSRGVAISSTPRVGAIAQWNAGESSAFYANGSATPNGSFAASSYGHVGYVAAVYADGSALIEQYNLGGDRSYSVLRMKAPRYLVF